MRNIFNKSVLLIFLSYVCAGTPFEYTLGLTSGYDSNVMRFSDDEFNEAITDNKLMGGANTFDSYVVYASAVVENINHTGTHKFHSKTFPVFLL